VENSVFLTNFGVK